MTPEQEAREEIDDQLRETGFVVQNASEMDIAAAVGVAVREFPLTTAYTCFAEHPAVWGTPISYRITLDTMTKVNRE